ncbi:MAG: hypothetical protein KDC97_12530 [Confluentibacter sp.]|nr:hypothetical protein [Confluentibacter sp.]
MKNILQKYLRLLVLFISFFSNQKTLANAAQPGIWNAGGTVFTMVYPEDSLSFKKVQMQQERIYIQLYKGFAVVKGTYIFKNTTNERLSFKMGYPVNGIYSGGEVDLNEVTIDSLSRFKIKANERWLSLIKEDHPELNNNDRNLNPFSDNWMVWQMGFEPVETQTVEIYFIVNTNDAKVRKGYNLENRNAFIYLLESGSVWHQPIVKGNFYIQLMDGLTIEDLKGLSSGFGFLFNKTHQIYIGTKTDFSPTPKDNLIVTYYECNERFVFDNVLVRAENLYAKMDELCLMPLGNLIYSKTEMGDPYEVDTTFWGDFPAFLTLFVIFAPLIIGLIVVVIIIWAFAKWRRIKRRKNKGA